MALSDCLAFEAGSTAVFAGAQPCMHAQDPRTAFNAAAASSDAATDSNSADVWEAARAAHEALLGISCTQLDIGMPDDLALQVRLFLGESGPMHASCQLV